MIFTALREFHSGDGELMTSIISSPSLREKCASPGLVLIDFEKNDEELEAQAAIRASSTVNMRFSAFHATKAPNDKILLIMCCFIQAILLLMIC